MSTLVLPYASPFTYLTIRKEAYIHIIYPMRWMKPLVALGSNSLVGMDTLIV